MKSMLLALAAAGELAAKWPTVAEKNRLRPDFFWLPRR